MSDEAQASPEIHALPRSRVQLIPRTAMVPVRVGGDDRLDFVHGQLTNDVRGLAAGAFNRSLQLNHKGHVLASALVFRRGDDLYLAAEAGGDTLLSSLRGHVVFDRVEIEDLRATLEVFTLLGREIPALLATGGITLPAADRFAQVEIGGASVLLHPAPWSPGAADLHLLKRDRERVIGVLSEAGAETAAEDLFELARIEAGVATAADAGEGVLPQEIGLDSAVSYRKGCYLGQEIMARIEARASLRRGPVRLRLSADPGGERDIVQSGRSVGRLGSVVGHPDGSWRALAVLRSDLGGEQTPTVAGVPLAGIEPLQPHSAP